MRNRCALLACLVLAFCLPLSAQAGLGAYFSYWDSGDMDTGFGFGGKYSMPVFAMVHAEARGGYLNYSDTSASLVPLEVGAGVDIAMLYATLGVGYYVWSIDGASGSDEFGSWIQGGAKMGLGGVAIFGGIKYTSTSTKVEGNDRNADGWGINAGVLLMW